MVLRTWLGLFLCASVVAVVNFLDVCFLLVDTRESHSLKGQSQFGLDHGRFCETVNSREIDSLNA